MEPYNCEYQDDQQANTKNSEQTPRSANKFQDRQANHKPTNFKTSNIQFQLAIIHNCMVP